MRFLRKLILCTAMLVMMFTVTAFAATTLYVSGDNVRVRSTPSTATKSNIVGSANKGDVCTVIYEDGDWTEVEVNGTVGYIRNDFLQTTKIAKSKAKTTSTPTPTANTSSGSGDRMVWVPKTGSKMHSNPSCSRMKNPSHVTVDQARAMGYTDYCNKCN